jgi:hypothetical protein
MFVIFLCCVVVSGESLHYQCCLIVHDDAFRCAMINASSLVHFFLCVQVGVSCASLHYLWCYFIALFQGVVIVVISLIIKSIFSFLLLLGYYSLCFILF